MMTREGTVKLIDFGIATRSGTEDSSLTGKPAYMAPEMVLELRADNRSDLFSLGAVLLRDADPASACSAARRRRRSWSRWSSGRVPSPREQNPAIPDGVMAILRKALQRDPVQRYARAGEMGQACEHHLYDKGYGPTNLALKRYLSTLFPADQQPAEELPSLAADLIPVEEVRDNPADRTPVAPIHRPAARPEAPAPGPAAPIAAATPANQRSGPTAARPARRPR